MSARSVERVPPRSIAPGAVAVRVDRVTKTYGGRRNPVHALREVSFDFVSGSFTAVMGPSGSGKSSLLNCAAGLVTPTSGEVYLGETPLSGLSEAALSKLRRDRIGFVFQAYNLLSALTVEQNVVLPLRLAGRRAPKDRVRNVLHRVGLADRVRHRPPELSGGEQQRASIARALVTDPAVVFADEPTGALDTHSASEVLALLREAVDGFAQTVVMVTHDPVAASFADSVVLIADGQLAGVLDRPTADVIADRVTSLGAWGPAAPAPARPLPVQS